MDSTMNELKIPQEVKRPYRGVWTDAEMLSRKDISLLEKLILAEVVFFADKGCFLSNAELARRFGQSRNGVSKAISRLTEKGEIVVEGKDCYHRKLLSIANSVVGKGAKPDNSVGSTEGKSAEQSDNSVVGCANSVVGSTAPTANYGSTKVDRSHIKEQTTTTAKTSKTKKSLQTEKVFTKPTIEQLKEEIRKKGYSGVDADEFYLKYEGNGWRVQRNTEPMENWKLTLYRWYQTEQKAGAKDGQTTTRTARRNYQPEPAETGTAAIRLA